MSNWTNRRFSPSVWIHPGKSCQACGLKKEIKLRFVSLIKWAHATEKHTVKGLNFFLSRLRNGFNKATVCSSVGLTENRCSSWSSNIWCPDVNRKSGHTHTLEDRAKRTQEKKTKVSERWFSNPAFQHGGDLSVRTLNWLWILLFFSWHLPVDPSLIFAASSSRLRQPSAHCYRFERYALRFLQTHAVIFDKEIPSLKY